MERGLTRIRESYAGSVARGRLDQTTAEQRLALIQGGTDFADLADADLIIEAVFENLAIEQAVFRQLEAVARPKAILATNTSTFDVDAIARVTKRPRRVVGTHVFSPAQVMRLRENVRGAQTDHETIATVMQLAKHLGKIGVPVGVCDGFVGNRMLYA